MNISTLRKKHHPPTYSKTDSETTKRQAEKGNATTRKSLSERDYRYIRDLIYKETRINLGDAKRELVTARLGKRLRATGIASFEAYCKELKNESNAGELYHLIDAISTNHTFFFREVAHFNFLEQRILPEFDAGHLGSGNEMKVWSCACSTGEEPYTLALIGKFDLQQSHPEINLRITATDVDPRLLERARAACYQSSSLKDLPQEWRERAFTPVAADLLRLQAAYRGDVDWQEQDIRVLMPPGRFHLIRNMKFC